MNINKNFVGSKMNKSLDERLIPKGDYIDAMNIRVSSSEDGQAGSAENVKGNTQLTRLENITRDAVCIGVFEDGINETIYWFVADTNADMIVSYDERNGTTRYHIVDSAGVLNFSKDHLMNGVNLIEDLLFFTDNYNPPRRININRSYPDLTAEDLLVIVKPPTSAPTLVLSETDGDENYMEDKFIRFSYRYKYKDGEYSALSEFSSLAFVPGNFDIDYSTFDMTGMQNTINNATVGFNTGGDNVVGVDVCFKTSTSNVVFVIEKFDKDDSGWNDNADVSIVFNNKKIYTALLEAEILRLYDNVPKLAKAQTTMGNRIIYGNYVDGYDIDTNIDYDLELNSEEIGFSTLDEDRNDGAPYLGYIDPVDAVVVNSNVTIDLTDIDLIEGATIYMDFNIAHNKFSGDPSYVNGTEVENSFENQFVFNLPRDYSSAFDLATSDEFVEAIQSDEDWSLTQRFLDSIILNTDNLWQLRSTPSFLGFDDFRITNTFDTISLQIPVVQYELVASPGAPFAYEYFNYAAVSASFVEIGSRESLHSNRDYEVGIVYMDDFSRASTALVCQDNTVMVPASVSDQKNTITATINNLAPSWATRYRFVMKPNKENYETVYSNLYFFDSLESAWWIKLEGDNISKVTVGDRLLVKSDSNGAINDDVKTKVLELKTQEENFIDPASATRKEPSGVYMKLRPKDYNIQQIENALISEGTLSRKGSYPVVAYPMFVEDSGTFEEFDLPAGSKVRISFKDKRNGSKLAREYVFNKEYTAGNNYDTFYDFLLGENVDFSVPTQTPTSGSDVSDPTAVFLSEVGDEVSVSPITGNIVPIGLESANGQTRIQYYRDVAYPGKAWLMFRSGNKRSSSRSGKIYVYIEVIRAGDVLIFETEAIEADPVTYYESSESFDIVNQFHKGNVQNQDASNNAIVDLDFFNCYSFGNGAESYKINDGLADPGFLMGERVTAVAEEDYKEAHRYADLTYSGVYNEESNVNKLNEFNLGLVNYKPLEKIFGPIQKIHARQTDVLVLQEDKISYVLSGKNLLSDAAAGGAIFSTPEVLGTQMSRLEENGISNNPESFAVYGYDIFFTDAKRNAVLNLKGSGYQNDQLSVISNAMMRSWFRDMFSDNFNTFKLGGYDPYHNEYILSNTEREAIDVVQEIGCGTVISQETSNDVVTYNVLLNEGTGDVDIDYEFDEGSATVVVSYNNVDVIDESISGTGTVTFTKSELLISDYTITITPTDATYSMTLGCADTGEDVEVIRMVSNDAVMEGKTIHHEYKWVLGTNKSQTIENLITFGSGPTSFSATTIGVEGVGAVPMDGATVTMSVIEKDGDLAKFENSALKYLQTDTRYSNIEDLLPNLNNVKPVLNPENGVYEVSFTYNTGFDYLYLVWDYKVGNPISLCYSDYNALDVCCNCI